MSYKSCKVVVILCLILTASVKSTSEDDNEWSNSKSKSNSEDGWCLWKLGAAVVGGVGALALAPVVLTVVGFGSAGIAAGSVAAAAQSYVGVVTAGSTIAALQSAGAAGIGLGAKAAIGGIGAAAAYHATEDSCDPSGRKKCND